MFLNHANMGEKAKSRIRLYLDLLLQIVTKTLFILGLKLLFLFGSEERIRKVAVKIHKFCNLNPDDPVSPEEHLYSLETFSALISMTRPLIRATMHNPVQKGDAVYDVPLIKLNSNDNKRQGQCQSDTMSN